MLDQSFSFKNFKTIHEIENRKGNYYEEFYSDDYHETIVLIDSKRREIKEEKFNSGFTEKYDELLKQKEDFLQLRDEYLENDLMEVAKQINNKDFNLKLLSFISTIDSKTIYSIEKTPSAYFAIKQLQYNIYRTFKVKQANRHQLVKQVKVLFADNFPKYILRTDIRQFYESVPQHRLLELIENNQLLSPKSKSLIKNILYNYNVITNQVHLPVNLRLGIPRGVGISAFLAELYMRKIDEEIKSIIDVSYYGRYVDDIVIIFTPKVTINFSEYMCLIRKIIEDKGLKMKDGTVRGEKNKTKIIDIFNPTAHPKEVNFLGYKFEFTGGKFNGIRLSDDKKNRYKEKIIKSFEEYLNTSIYDNLQSKKLLIHRINYITKNTRLHRPKKGMIGIYYSNSLLENNCQCLKDLDVMLKEVIDDKLPTHIYPSLNLRMKRFSFLNGFINKLYFNINSKKKSIPDLRPSHEKSSRPLVNNFEKIVYAWK